MASVPGGIYDGAVAIDGANGGSQTPSATTPLNNGLLAADGQNGNSTPANMPATSSGLPSFQDQQNQIFMQQQYASAAGLPGPLPNTASSTFAGGAGGRSFSGNQAYLANSPLGMAGMPGASPSSPYLDHQQYAAAAAAAAAALAGTQGVGGNGMLNHHLHHLHSSSQPQSAPPGPQNNNGSGGQFPGAGSTQGGNGGLGGANAANMPPLPHSASFLDAASAQGPLGAAQLFNHPAFAAAAAMAAAGAVPGGLPGGFLSPHSLGLLSPHSQSLQQAAAGAATGRTVYVGNLPAEASVDELLSQVKFGPIENVRILPEKNCAFISFLDGNMAAAFHADASVKKMSLHDQELKIGWGKPSACPAPILMAVQQNQATRNVYLGMLDEETTEQSLRDDLSRFGPIDQVKIVRDKNIGFVHFLSITTAMKVVTMLPNEPGWANKRINYGKDRCAYVPKSQQQNQAHNSQAAAMGMAAAASLGYPTGMSPAALSAFNPASPLPGSESRSPAAVASVFAPMANATALQQMGNRTVYLGNIHPDTTTEEICNHIRGGILQNIRFIPEKHIAFITFIESNAALAFFHLACYSGIMIHQRRLKIGWGKHSGPLGPAIAMAVQAGGSRNVYIGNIENFDYHTVEKLRADFSEYGETELVNTFREKNCAFVNFCNIQNAIKAIEAMKNHPDYKNQRIGAGKDRCGNAPRAVTNSLQAANALSPGGAAADHSAAFIGSPIEVSSPPSAMLAGDESAMSGAADTSVGEKSLGSIVGTQDNAA